MSTDGFVSLLKEKAAALKNQALGSTTEQVNSRLPLFLRLQLKYPTTINTSFVLQVVSASTEGEGGSTWKVLKDDYMLDARIRDWEASDSSSEG